MDLIERQAAIDAVLDRMSIEKYGRDAKPEEIRWTLEKLPPAQPEIIRCKDCKHRYTDECPMRHIEFLECDEDGEYDGRDIVYDYTEDESFCSWGEKT